MGVTHPVLGVEARVNDTIHIQVQVVELDAVRVRRAGVHGTRRAVGLPGLILDDVLDDEGVFLRQPAVEGGDSHRVRSPVSPSV